MTEQKLPSKSCIIENTTNNNISNKFLKAHGLTRIQACMIVNDIDCHPQCRLCGSPVRFISFARGFAQYCGKKCSNKGKWENTDIEQANLKRKLYWTEHPEERKRVNAAMSATNKVVWGKGTELRKKQQAKVDHVSRLQKAKQTKLRKYGDANPWKTGGKLFIQSMERKYGVKNARQVKSFVAKAGQTWIKRYGVKSPFKFEGVAERAAQTRKRNYLNRIKDRSLLDNYYKQVWSITRQQELESLEHIEKRGRSSKNSDNYQLDHIFSISQGYAQNIDPRVIGSIHNLRMIPWRENINKRARCDIALEELYAKVSSK